MRLYEITVMVRDDQRIERETWEVEAPTESEARRLAESKLRGIGTGEIVRVKDTLFRSRA